MKNNRIDTDYLDKLSIRLGRISNSIAKSSIRKKYGNFSEMFGFHEYLVFTFNEVSGLYFWLLIFKVR